MGEKSGVLTVERGEGRSLEEGLIIFARGQVVEARVNQRSGLAAFTYLNAWQVCHFSFIAQAAKEALSPPQITQPLPPANGGFADNTSIADSPYFDTVTQVSHADGLHEYRDIPAAQFIIPFRLLAGEEMLQRPENNGRLPRVHRRLLLLINGQRSVSQLARLMARNIDELQELLNDLERSGFIRL
jgi:hypothetical protein